MMNRQRLVSYSGLDEVNAVIKKPESVEELKRFLIDLNNKKQPVTLRCGGYSFHSQSLNETIIDMSGLKNIAPPDLQNKCITVGPGAIWEEIIGRTLPKGLVPRVLVTVRKAQAGGTISANCFSRSSIRYGRDGNNVSSFKLLTVDGDIKNCSLTENEDLFHAAIGGFGYLGAIIEITYNLLEIGNKKRVETTVNKCVSPEAIVKQLESNMGDKEWNAVYALLFVSDKGDKRGIVFKSKNVEEAITDYNFGDYNGRSFNSMFGLLSINYPINKLYNLIYDKIDDGFQSVDNFDDYTFLMDGHRKFKETVNQLGWDIFTIQQTYLIPNDKIVGFLSHLFELIENKRILPSFFDVVPIPADEFTLSSSRKIDGFAVSIAFDRLPVGAREKLIGSQGLSDSDIMTLESIPELGSNDADEIREICNQLENISSECQNLGGRVHLIKNVYSSCTLLRQMYSPQMATFLKLKKKYDPNEILRNDFFNRVFC
jgi:decaprenylphospho-beta-D-ribofuranose 2-oxidase